MTDAWIGLGSNLGDRRQHLQAALAGLRTLGRLHQVSSLYETEPVGFQDQGAFLNAAARLETSLPPRDLLTGLLEIEAARGRIRSRPNSPRTLDLDLLFYGATILDEAGLHIPHPRLHERRFVLVPLCELAPHFQHPLLLRSLAHLLRGLNDPSSVVLFQTFPDWAAESIQE